MVFVGENGLVSVGEIVVPGSTTLMTTVFVGSNGTVVVVGAGFPSFVVGGAIVGGTVPETTFARHSLPGR
jgi:hypothetical protein